ncbi:MAG: transglycosylase SLT domain-containing protein [Woeseia sp.]|nr:transglycosylase SLT domain-containing protein [Woeseia sp.]NNL53601.1 transglycosylase SLT domain-containing protein [Woeseia sp.]
MNRIKRTVTILLAVCSPGLYTSATTIDIDDQRQAFREAYPNAELGVWSLPAEREALLRRYVLWPELRAAYLRTRLRTDHAEIKQFLASYADLKPARELRFRYALELARQEQWSAFRDIYNAHYRHLGNARLDCLALRADMDSLSEEKRRQRVTPLWLIAGSQAKECDPVFTRLRRLQVLDDNLYKERFALAVENRELGIARYLARSLPDAYQQTARNWTRAIGLPRQFLEEHDATEHSAEYREQLQGAIKQIAYDEPELAERYWHKVAAQHAFSPAERAATEQHIALWLARTHHLDARRALDELPAAAVDDEVLRWRVRIALREARWADVLQHISAMPADLREGPQWQYWRAVALQKTGDREAARLFATLADERSYYGFLAADALDQAYAYQNSELIADDAVLKSISQLPEIQRARELFLVGLDGRGRSAWDAAVLDLSAQEQVQAAILAHRWGWHSRAIATAARNEQFDDLAIRYPMPYAAEFARFAGNAGIRPSWAFSIARSESLFMPDIRSSAGAIGVMQLMPATGRRTARQLKLPYQGRATLTNPVDNIQLGTWFLGNMQQRFADHSVLATAAYNAGPHRVDDWLPGSDSLDARIWIETIPYAETRGYVRRVLTAETIFHWRMTGDTDRLSARLAPVLPLERVAALVAAQEPASSAND